MKKTFLKYFFKCNILLFILGCTDIATINPENILQFPEIKPDYTNITIPPNIAPLNFQVKEDGLAFFVRFSCNLKILMEIFSTTGKVMIPLSKWKNILKDNINQEIQITVFCKDKQSQWKKFKPFNYEYIC